MQEVHGSMESLRSDLYPLNRDIQVFTSYSAPSSAGDALAAPAGGVTFLVSCPGVASRTLYMQEVVPGRVAVLRDSASDWAVWN
eukprot:13582057-Alexandrium_andersonii.AAC.1